eukprot:Hpha_TRINITY_DN16229_c2_g11::TRINITY_DN16229_c2_g11_i1::g.14515::m.14515/K01179/E3.2.1.4; endoglucanase
MPLLGTTSTEYLLRGIGMRSWTEYNWGDPTNAITAINQEEVDAVTAILKPAANESVVPAVRIPLCASSWLGVNTTAASGNMAKYPDLGGQYRTLVGNLVSNYTSAGIVTILDLHWSDDDTSQQPMALRGPTNPQGGPTGDAVAFWDSVASLHGANKMVFFELYNEPHTDTQTWLKGSSQYVGITEMAAAVRAHTPDSVMIVGGATAYAYDADSLVELWNEAGSNSNLTNVIANFHPYMGAPQAGALNKCPAGFEAFVRQVGSKTQFPMIITEFGQHCCPTGTGQCYNCPASPLGYDDDILAICTQYQVSWLPWAWRPSAVNSSGGSCQDLNGGNAEGTSLAGPVVVNGTDTGADFQGLWVKYNNLAPTPAPTPAPPTPTPKPTPVGQCNACGYNCDANCVCGRCNTKQFCDNPNSCLSSCNGGGNAKWCGGS